MAIPFTPSVGEAGVEALVAPRLRFATLGVNGVASTHLHEAD
jgi:hypothetical protein